jgi:hypothetical protein
MQDLQVFSVLVVERRNLCEMQKSNCAISSQRIATEKYTRPGRKKINAEHRLGVNPPKKIKDPILTGPDASCSSSSSTVRYCTVSY